MLVLVMALSITFICTGFAHAYDMREYYPLNVGDEWKYNIVEKDIVEEEGIEVFSEEIFESWDFVVKGKDIIGKATVYMIAEGDEVVYEAVESEVVKRFKRIEGSDIVKFDPPKPLFLNLEVGESNKFSLKNLYYNADINKTWTNKEQVELGLESIEDVIVPAGKFSGCLKFRIVSKKRTHAESRYVEEENIIWLAKGVGIVKTVHTKRDVIDASNAEIEQSLSVLASAVIDGKKI
ncbi:MAG: hypothetical protein HQ558_00365 [Candidatus Omnitrophica bacterium]|nr:hypothetical protein [Candidatus Omnitrophota bacterium]